MKKRFLYWFDNQMSKGTGRMIGMLTAATILIALLFAGGIIAMGAEAHGGLLSAFWDSLAVTINAEMPYSNDGDISYVILTAISAAIGLLFTSVLIGIVNNAIEEKLSALRKGNSVVLEKGHTVILGFKSGEYELITQLVLAAEGKKTCLVIAERMDREEMEEAIRENVRIPGNVKIICRNIDICDSKALEVCSLFTCANIVIAPAEDGRTLKTMLAVSSALGEAEKEKIQVVAAVSKDEFLLPANVAGKNGILMLQTHDIAARIIAHACTQPGLSEAFTDIFNFEGSEFYLRQMPEMEGKRFAQLMNCVDGGVPVGICHEKVITVNPGGESVLQKGDSLLLFAENEKAIRITNEPGPSIPPKSSAMEETPEGAVLVIGFNEVLDTVLQELPKSIHRVIVAGINEVEESVVRLHMQEYPERDLVVVSEDIMRTDILEKNVRQTEYVVLLSNHELDEENADIQSIQLLLRLRDIKARLALNFTITAEMRCESNRNLMMAEDTTDFIVASNMTSMILAQLVENPMLYGVFQELLSNVGNELYLKSAAAFSLEEKDKTTAEIRVAALSKGYILLGYIKDGQEGRIIRLNPPLKETVRLHPQDRLIVIGEQ